MVAASSFVLDAGLPQEAQKRMLGVSSVPQVRQEAIENSSEQSKSEGGRPASAIRGQPSRPPVEVG
jgi:hypothetical protein